MAGSPLPMHGTPRDQPHHLGGVQQGRQEYKVIIIVTVIANSSRKLLFSDTHYVPAVTLYTSHTATPSTQRPSGKGTIISPLCR